MEFLQHTWYLLVGVLLAGYAVLDGFDLGIGFLLPVLAKDDKERRTLFNAVGPFWDGNEVWLLTGGGALFAAFPNVYATVFSGFYLALMLVLFALIFRAVSLEFWKYDSARSGLWRWAFTTGSLLPALLYGVALGNVVQGIPLDGRWEFTGTFFTLLRPFPLALGLLGLAAFALQGCTWAALKSDGVLRQRAQDWGRRSVWAVGILFLFVFGLALAVVPGVASRPLVYVAGLLVLFAVWMSRSAIAKGKDKAAFLASSGLWLALWFLVGIWHYPNLVRDTAEVNPMTLFNASSSQLTLTVMLIIALVGMPVVIGYTLFAYRAFKGKVSLD